MSAALRIAAAGPYSTLQDRGRFGYQRFGVSPAGAFDPLRLAAANALVGNPPDQAAIEITMLGDTYEIAADGARLALAGDFALQIDGAPAEPWRSFRLSRGQRFKIGMAKRGLRGYVAVEGGFAVAPTLGSLSTHVRTGIGGLGGAKLKAGDILPLARADASARAEAILDPALWSTPRRELRVVLGPQDDCFAAEAQATLFSSEYEVTRDADRMGYRLDGPKIAHAKGFDIVSDGMPLGAVQIPGTGTPILLLVDRQSAGGYPKIATVISPDIALLAQTRPGDKLRFRAVDAREARAAALDFRATIDGMARLAEPV
jgi:biotin-dependent carboxylase-like uncharacterized protein